MATALLAVGIFHISSSQVGTAQDLTLGIPMGVTVALVLISLFLYRSGHERAHRLQVLREERRQELEHQRPEMLEAIHREPRVEEGAPQ
jgi:hypothetical protein